MCGRDFKFQYMKINYRMSTEAHRVAGFAP